MLRLRICQTPAVIPPTPIFMTSDIESDCANNWPEDWLRPRWPAPESVRAVFTSRNGGVSTGVFASFNLGAHVSDDPDHVRINRASLQRRLGVRPVFLNQVHGADVLRLGPDAPVDGVCADACVTARPGLACTVMVADCLPVLLCDPRGRQVGAAHAGWRGLLGEHGRGVLESAVGAMRMPHTVAASEPLLAWLGPCIGPAKFEVGGEVRDAFLAAMPHADRCFKPFGGGKWLADLPGLARQRLQALGSIAVFGNDGSDAWCTVSQASRFFSHRRDRVSGRMAACIWLEN